MKIQVIARNSGELVANVEMPVVPSIGDAVVVKGKRQTYLAEGESHSVRAVQEFVVRQRRFFVHCEVENVPVPTGGWVAMDGGQTTAVVLICDTKDDFHKELHSVSNVNGEPNEA